MRFPDWHSPEAVEHNRASHLRSGRACDMLSTHGLSAAVIVALCPPTGHNSEWELLRHSRCFNTIQFLAEEQQQLQKTSAGVPLHTGIFQKIRIHTAITSAGLLPFAYSCLVVREAAREQSRRALPSATRPGISPFPHECRR